MTDRTLFELPIYRLSFDDWSAEADALMEPHRRAMVRQGRIESDLTILAQRAIRHVPWDYNEVVGWVRVNGLHDVIKAHVWLRTGKRFHRKPTTPFEYLGNLSETWIYPEQSNQAIASEVKTGLVDGVNGMRGRRAWFLDLTTYDAVAPFLDWKLAVGMPQ